MVANKGTFMQNTCYKLLNEKRLSLPDYGSGRGVKRPLTTNALSVMLEAGSHGLFGLRVQTAITIIGK